MLGVILVVVLLLGYTLILFGKYEWGNANVRHYYPGNEPFSPAESHG